VEIRNLSAATTPVKEDSHLVPLLVSYLFNVSEISKREQVTIKMADDNGAGSAGSYITTTPLTDYSGVPLNN